MRINWLLPLFFLSAPAPSLAASVEDLQRFVDTVSHVAQVRRDAFDVFSNRITEAFPGVVVKDKSARHLEEWSRQGAYWDGQTTDPDNALAVTCRLISAQGLDKMQVTPAALTPPDLSPFEIERPVEADFTTWTICSGSYTLRAADLDFDTLMVWYSDLEAQFTAAGLRVDRVGGEAHRPVIPGALRVDGTLCDQGVCIRKVHLTSVYVEEDNASVTTIEVHAFERP